MLRFFKFHIALYTFTILWFLYIYKLCKTGAKLQIRILAQWSTTRNMIQVCSKSLNLLVMEHEFQIEIKDSRCRKRQDWDSDLGMCVHLCICKRECKKPWLGSWVCEWFQRASQRSPSPGYKNSGNGEKSKSRLHTAAINKKELLELI